MIFPMYGYGARFYDPAVGRFTSIDPLADQMPSWSPYSYTYNNPLRFLGPTGKGPEDIITYNTAGQEISRIEAPGEDVHLLQTNNGVLKGRKESFFGDRTGSPKLFSTLDKTSVPNDNAVERIVDANSDGNDGLLEFAKKSVNDGDYDYKNTVLGEGAGIDNSETAYEFMARYLIGMKSEMYCGEPLRKRMESIQSWPMELPNYLH